MGEDTTTLPWVIAPRKKLTPPKFFFLFETTIQIGGGRGGSLPLHTEGPQVTDIYYLEVRNFKTPSSFLGFGESS